jgi:hypothetical protein
MDAALSYGQNWQQNDLIFNPSGIPSLRFSQPRFADLDADGDYDLILGNIDDAPVYFRNSGSVTSPAFQAGADIFAPIDPLDAEVGVCVDLDADGDLDLICGGYTGLQLYDNTGNATEPVFHRIDGFFAGLTVGISPVPAFADLDGDVDLDLLVGLSENGELKFYPNTGTSETAEYLETNAETWYDVGLYAYPWFSDLDDDSDYDLLVGRDGHGFRFYWNIGDASTWQWQADDSVFLNLAGTTYWNSPCLVDLTGDGLPDLVYGTDSGPLHYYVNTGSTTVPVWTANNSLFGGVLDVGGASSPFFFDFDHDGDLDLVSGSQLGDIKYYVNVGTSHAPAWQADHALFASIDHSIYSAITLGDVDADGLPDAIAGDLSGNLFFHHNTGSGFSYDSSVFLGVNLGGWSVPRLVDMDGDSDLDIVAGNENGLLFYFENTGGIDSPDWTEVPGFFGGLDVGTNCVPTLGDFDQDDDLDLMTGNLFHEIRFFENVGADWVEDATVVAGITAGQNAAPALADLDGDGDLDLTIGNYGGTFNYYENINPISHVAPQEVPQRGSRITSVYPNPFNPRVTVEFSLQVTGPVTLAIHDVMGRVVAKLVDGDRPAGSAAITWNGRDRSGAPVASGVYFARLQTANGVSRQKLVLAR